MASVIERDLYSLAQGVAGPDQAAPAVATHLPAGNGIIGEPRGASAVVVLPTYNEIENLLGITGGILDQRVDILIVDDASPDGTGRLADRLAATQGGVQVLHRRAKSGLGSAYAAGFRAALLSGYEYVFEMDADGSHDPSDLNRLLQVAQSTQGLAIGSRYVKGGSTAGWPLDRRVLSRAANMYCGIILGFQVHDWTSGFRCYPSEVLRGIGNESMFCEGYAFQIEMAFRCLRRGFRLTEVPIVFKDRLAGESKVTNREIREAVFCALGLRALSLSGWRSAESPYPADVELLEGQVAAALSRGIEGP